VVPAYNEGLNLDPVITGTVRALGESTWAGPYEVVLVDDGSTDDSAAVVEGLTRRFHDRVRACRHLVNRGLGAALRTGYAAALGEYVTFIPADGEVEFDQALALFQKMGDADLMVSRRERPVGACRTLLTTGFHWLTRLILGFDARGTDGIYVIQRATLCGLTLRSDTGLVNLELVMQCRRQRCRIDSGVTHASPRLSGASKVANVRSVSRMLWEMVRLRLR
jgi:glycosyltransferase involved in cell wall biosynthesis